MVGEKLVKFSFMNMSWTGANDKLHQLVIGFKGLGRVEIEFDFGPGKVVKTFDLNQSRQVGRDWMSVYCKNEQGYNTKAFKWHIFSGGGYPSVSGEEARAAYGQHEATLYVIMPNTGGCAVLTDAKPTSCSLSDYYVFPENLAWTMAFTHEEGWLGPYFAKHPQYSSLQQEIFQQIEKQHQKELARKKGWW
ncbi:DUF4275 family protein [Hahella ganghwensis]|uniref:DUF4275 family protein n=1 Tax=Hahella ganghwensis TaxID=286420 RepID=UPI000378E053|nr:DUF4275 family protein [Hahella ganghwensis]